MTTSFAALLFRPAEVPDRALSQGFAVALAGWDVPSPRLLVADLPGIPGFRVAFYASGLKEDAFDHACELFEDELPPALAVHDAVAELGHPEAVIYAITYAEGAAHDDVWRVDARGVERHFVHEGDEAVEVGFETPEAGEVQEIDPDLDDAAIEAAARPHRGSTFLSRELGAPAIPALVGALFAADRRVPVRLAEPDPASIEAEVRRLDRALGRVAGRGAPALPDAVAGVPAPASYQAFARAYDWADPSDPGDLYRELAIGAIEGTLRFLRPDDLRALDTDPAWAAAAKAGVFPIARLAGSALGGSAAPRGIVALGGDGERLVLVPPKGSPREAGPTFGELIRYLALGWSKRTDAEEDMIGALMLRAKLRAG